MDCYAVPGCGDAANSEVRSFTVQGPAPPNTLWLAHPRRVTRKRTARFAFRSDQADVTFECFVRTWIPCVSPTALEAKVGLL